MSPPSDSEIKRLARAIRPDRGLPLRKNFLWIIAGNVVYAGCQWAMLIVLAKLGSAAMVGQFALGLAVTAPVFMFCSLDLQTVLATEARGKYHFFQFLSLRLITTLLGLLIVAAIILLTRYKTEIKLVILVLALAKAIESISDIIHGLLMQHERMDKVATSMMIKGPLSLLALGVAIYLTNNILWGVAGLIIVWAALLLSYDYINGISCLGVSSPGGKGILPGRASWIETNRPHFSMKLIWRIGRLTLPLGLVLMLDSFNVNAPRYFIDYYIGEQELGHFVAMAYLVLVGQTIIAAMGISTCPRLAKHLAAGEIKVFRHLAFKLLGISILLGAASVLITQLAGREILSIVYRPEYADHLDTFFWLMVAGAFSYVAWFLAAVSTAARYIRIQVPLVVWVTVTLALACWWLIPLYGLWGAAMACVITTILRALVYTAVFTHLIYICSNREKWKIYYG